MNCSMPGFPVHHHLLEVTQTHVHRVSNAIHPSIFCHPLFLLPPILPSIRAFSIESTLHMRWPKYWSFSFSIIPSKEHPGLISFRKDRLDLLAVQGTLKSLLQHHSSKASILWCSAFFTVQLSHPNMTTVKTIALTRQCIEKQRHCFSDKGLYSQSYGFSSNHMWMWESIKGKHERMDAFRLWCWRRLLRVPWTVRSNQSILKEINPEHSLGGLMLKLKYFGLLMWRADSLEKTLMLESLKAKGEGSDRGWDGSIASMANEHEFE